MTTTKKLAAIFLALALGAAGSAMAQTTPAPAATNAPAAPRARAPMLTGTVASVDSTGMMLTLKAASSRPETKVKITSSTKFRKDGEPAEFSTVVEGMKVRIAGKKGDDGVWTARSVSITTKAKTAKPKPPAATPAAPGQ